MAAPVHHETPIEQILGLHDKLKVPEGHKAEVIEGTIIVSPSPSGRHSVIYAMLQRQLDQMMPAHFVVTNTVTLEMTATGERYMPDILVMGRDVLDSDDWLFPADRAELVVEIVSPHNARHDRGTKVRGYAASGVPIYLLVDPIEQAVTLFYEPAGDAYRQVHRVPFGSSIALPDPYHGKIETGSFA